MKYIIATEESHESKLVTKVNELLQKGWKLQGGISVTVTNGNYKVWAQALIKEDD